MTAMNTSPAVGAAHPHGYNERQGRFEPPEPAAFTPASTLLCLDVATLIAHPPVAAHGLTLHEVAEHAGEARDALRYMQHIPEVAAAVDALDIAIAVYDEVNGLLK